MVKNIYMYIFRSDGPRLTVLTVSSLIHPLLVVVMSLACRHDSGITPFILRLTLGKFYKRKDLKDEVWLVGLADVCLVNLPTAVSLSFSIGTIEKTTGSHAGDETWAVTNIVGSQNVQLFVRMWTTANCFRVKCGSGGSSITWSSEKLCKLLMSVSKKVSMRLFRLLHIKLSDPNQTGKHVSYMRKSFSDVANKEKEEWIPFFPECVATAESKASL